MMMTLLSKGVNNSIFHGQPGFKQSRMDLELIKKELEVFRPIVNREDFFKNFTYPVGMPFDYWQQGMKPSGVYLLGDFYVGQTNNIKERTKRHYRGYITDLLGSSSKIGMRRWIEQGRMIPVFWLSSLISDEFKCANTLVRDLNLPLINTLRDCLGYEPQDQIIQAIMLLNRHGYTVIPPAEFPK